MSKNVLYIILMSFAIISCKSNKKELTAKQIIDQTIERAGREIIEDAQVTFDFRGDKIKIYRHQGNYMYSRVFTDSLGNQIEDKISNEGFQRTVDGQMVSLSDSIASVYAHTLDVYLYFTMAPFHLMDSKLETDLLADETINDIGYWKVQVIFAKDKYQKHQNDRFVYWIRKEDYVIDYFAYSWNGLNDGSRFVVPQDRVNINGVSFSNYISYKPIIKTKEIKDFDVLYLDGYLKKVSDIILENIEVKANPI